MVKRGLGRGLSALLPEEDIAAEERHDGVRMVACAEILPNPQQPRSTFVDEKIEELAASIREHGILQPLVLREREDGRFELIMGERRLRAAKLCGLEEVPAVLREADSQKMAELALIENLQREDLSPLEEAEAFRTIMAEHGVTQETLSQTLGKSRSYIANSVRLLSLGARERELLAAGRITAGHARALLSVPHEDGRLYLLEQILKNDLSVRQTEALAKQIQEAADSAKATRPTKRVVKTAYIRQMEDKMRASFGTKVEIRKSGRGGKIEIEYYSDEDLDRILTLLVEEESSL